MENVYKVYISGKISGLPHQDAYDKFEKAENDVKEMGFEPINPMKICPFNPDWSWDDYMVEDIKALFKCKAIYMLKDWGDSKGARIERSIAQEMGIRIIYQL